MKLRVRLTEEASQVVEKAAEFLGISRQDATTALLAIGWSAVQHAPEAWAQLGQPIDRLAQPGPVVAQPGPVKTSSGPAGPTPWPSQAQAKLPPANAPGPAGPGTEVALSSLSSLPLRERESERDAWAPPADWAWWQWDGSDDRLCARFVASDRAGHDAECCRTSEFLVHGALDIAQGFLETQQPLTAAQARGLRSAVRKVVGCEQQRRRESSKAERQAQVKAAEEQARKVPAPAWWQEKREQDLRKLEERQRREGSRRKQERVSGDVASLLPNKSAGSAGRESE